MPGAHRTSLTALFPAIADLLAGAGAGRAWPPLPALSRACLQASGPRGRLLEWSSRRRAGRWALRLMERGALPGLAAHFGWRKRWIGQRIVEHLAANGQLLLLGSGFDTLGLQVARRMQAAQVFELDLPAQIGIKSRHAAALGMATANWHPLAADLGRRGPVDGWRARLSRHPAWRPRAATVIVAEGLAMYLPPGSLARVLAGLRGVLDGEAVLLATAMDLRPDGRPGFAAQARWIDRWLRRSGEPFLWGSRLDELAARGRAWGLTGLERADPVDPRDPDPCPGEHVFLARLSGTCGTRTAAARRCPGPSPAPAGADRD